MTVLSTAWYWGYLVSSQALAWRVTPPVYVTSSSLPYVNLINAKLPSTATTLILGLDSSVRFSPGGNSIGLALLAPIGDYCVKRRWPWGVPASRSARLGCWTQ